MKNQQGFAKACSLVLLSTLALCASSPASLAQELVENYTLDNVWFLPESGSWDSVQPMTGTFQWTYTVGEFSDGSGQFLQATIPYYGSDIAALNVTVEANSMELTLPGNIHDTGVDVSIFFVTPLAPGQPSALDLTRCSYDVQQLGINHKGTMQSGNALPLPSSTAYCFGDGNGTPCPCGTSASPGEGCQNSTGTGGATLSSLGAASISSGTFQLSITGVPGNKPGLLLRGNAQVNSGLGNAVGDGLLCVSGQTARSHVQVTSNGATVFDQFGGVSFAESSYGAGLETHYQFWYRDQTNLCSGQGFNFSNAVVATWVP
jgi:hypothetical protein